MAAVDITASPYFAVGDGTTPNDAAFIAFRDWAAVQTGQVVETIPAGDYALTNLDLPLHAMGISDPPFRVIKNLVVNGAGATLQGGVFGGYVTSQAPFFIQTANAGERTVTFLDPADAAVFATDSNSEATRFAIVTGVEMQVSSYPPNCFYFEYLQVESVDINAGKVRFTTQLRNTYKSTWPSYNFTSDWVDGAASIYKIEPRFDCEIEINDVIFSKAGESNGGGRKITFNGCSWPNGGVVPSQAQTFIANNCQLAASGQQCEFDKFVTNATLTDCTCDGLFIIQSASNESLTVSGGTYDTFTGTPKNIVMDGVTVTGDFSIGPVGYGVAETVVLTDCSFGGIGYTRNLNAISDFSFSAGVFSRANASGPVFWAIPGARAWFMMNNDPKYIYSSFLITDITQDGTNTYIHTDLTDLPDWSGAIDPPDSIGTLGCTDVTVTNCVGCDEAVDLSSAPANSSVGTYAIRTLSGDLTNDGVGGAVYNLNVWGELVEFRINVIQPYTGAQATCTYHPVGRGGGCPVYDDDYVLSFWDVTINLKIAGERVITQSGVTGAQSGDTLQSAAGLHLLGRVHQWLDEDISADSSGEQPIVEIEVTTSQLGDSLSQVSFDELPTYTAETALITKRVGGAAIAAIHRRVPEKPGPAVRH